MTNVASDAREFQVHARHVDRHHAHLVSETSFEAAAVAFVEDYPHEVGGEPEVSVVVRELATGHEHCFKVDLGTGETEPCG